MLIPLDPSNPIPLYRQIADWLEVHVCNGSLPADTRLPATRGLAKELGVSRITVENAYSILQSTGLLVTREGSGTYVSSYVTQLTQETKPSQKTWPLWQTDRVSNEKLIIPFSQNSGSLDVNLISFTGVGDASQYPTRDLLAAAQTVFRKEGDRALDYGPFGQGYAPLRSTICSILASQGIHASPEHVLITTGSQQGLALVCHHLLREGDVILVEKPTYNLALALFSLLGLKIIDVPTDEKGMLVETIEPLLQKYHPRLIYTIPNFQNPGGTCLSLARRRLLLTLAACYNIPIVEDDFAGDLRFEGRGIPAIKALDHSGQVIYLGTFSKMLAPGLRVGYLAAEGPVFQGLETQKILNDLTTSPLLQQVLNQYMTLGRYQTHLHRSIRLYRKRRDILVDALKNHLPQLDFQIPQGGLFLWVRLPEGKPSSVFLAYARAEGVEFSPGSLFFSNPLEGENFFRMNFATNDPQRILNGVQRLACAFDKF